MSDFNINTNSSEYKKDMETTLDLINFFTNKYNHKFPEINRNHVDFPKYRDLLLSLHEDIFLSPICKHYFDKTNRVLNCNLCTLKTGIKNTPFKGCITCKADVLNIINRSIM